MTKKPNDLKLENDANNKTKDPTPSSPTEIDFISSSMNKQTTIPIFMGVANPYMKALLQAFLKEDEKAIREALVNTSINAKNALLESVPLVIARANPNINQWKLLIEFGANIESMYFGAAQGGHEILMLTLEKYAQKQKINIDYHEACYFAAWGQQSVVLEKLIEKVTFLPKPCTYSRVLDGCHISGNDNLVKKYTEWGHIVENSDGRFSTVLRSIESGNEDKALRMLELSLPLIRTKLTDPQEREYFESLISRMIGYATRRGLNILNAVKKIIAKDKITLNYQTILEETAASGQDDLLQLFMKEALEQPDHPERNDIDYFLIANQAIRFGHLTTAKILIPKIKEANQRIHDDPMTGIFQRLLKEAASNGHSAIMGYLITEINLSKQQPDFQEMANFCAFHGHTDIVLVVITQIKRLNAEPKYNEIFEMAAQGGKASCLKQILKVSNIKPDWFTIFHLAAGSVLCDQAILDLAVEEITGQKEETYFDLINRYVLMSNNKDSTLEKQLQDEVQSSIEKLNAAVLIAVTKDKKLTKILIERIVTLCGMPNYNKFALECIKDNDTQKILKYLLNQMRQYNIQPNYEEFIKAAKETLKEKLVNYKKNHALPRFKGKVNKKTKDLLSDFLNKNRTAIDQNIAYVHGTNGQYENVGLVLARSGVDISIIDLLYDYKANSKYLMRGAAEGGHLTLLTELIKRIESSASANSSSDESIYQQIAKYGALGGHYNVIEFALKLNSEKDNPELDFDEIATFAAHGGHPIIVRRIIQKIFSEKAIPEFGKIVRGAVCGGYTSLANVMLSKMEASVPPREFLSCLGGCASDAVWNKETVFLFLMFQKILKLGVKTYLEPSAVMAASHGHGDIVSLICAKAKILNFNIDYNQLLKGAALGGHEDLLAELFQKASSFGIPDFNKIACMAVGHRHEAITLDLIRIMKSSNVEPDYEKITGFAEGDFKSYLLQIVVYNTTIKSLGLDKENTEKRKLFDFIDNVVATVNSKMHASNSKAISNRFSIVEVRNLSTFFFKQLIALSAQIVPRNGLNDSHPKVLFKDVYISSFECEELSIDLKGLKQKISNDHIIRKYKLKTMTLSTVDLLNLIRGCILDSVVCDLNDNKSLVVHAANKLTEDLFVNQLCKTESFLMAAKAHDEKLKETQNAEGMKRFDLYYEAFLDFRSRFENSVSNFEEILKSIFILKLKIEVTVKQNNEGANGHKKEKQIINSNQSRKDVVQKAELRANLLQKSLSSLIASFAPTYEKFKADCEVICSTKNITQLSDIVTKLEEIEKACLKQIQELTAIHQEFETILERLEEQSKTVSVDNKRIQDSLEAERKLAAQAKLIEEQTAILDAIKTAREERERAIKQQKEDQIRSEKRKRWMDEIQRRKDAAIKARADKLLKAELEKLRIEKHKKEELDELKKEKIARMDEKTRQIIEQHLEEFKIMLSQMTFLDENSEAEICALLGKLAQTLEAMKHYKGNLVLSTLAKEARNTLYHGANLLDPKMLAEYCANPKSASSKTEDCSNPKSHPFNIANLRERLLKMNLELLTFDWESNESLEEILLPELFVELVLYPRKIAHIDVKNMTPNALSKILEKNTEPNMPKINKIKTPTYVVCKKNVDIHYRKLVKIQKDYSTNPNYRLVFEAAQGYCHAKISKYARRLKKIDKDMYEKSSKGNGKILEEIIKLGDKFRHNLPVEVVPVVAVQTAVQAQPPITLTFHPALNLNLSPLTLSSPPGGRGEPHSNDNGRTVNLTTPNI